jgi:hypothetical protein
VVGLGHEAAAHTTAGRTARGLPRRGGGGLGGRLEAEITVPPAPRAQKILGKPAAPCPIGPSPGTGFLPEKDRAVVSARRQATPGVGIALRTSSRWPAGPLSGVASGGLHRFEAAWIS